MLLTKLQEDLKQAQLSRDAVKVSTLRLLISEIKYAAINKNQDLSDEDIISIIQKEAKKRNESIISFRAGGREDLAAKEETEMKILQIFLPQQLSKEELTKIVEEAINETGASKIADMGQVMGVVMGKTKGRADGSIVNQIVKEKLS